MNVSGAQLFWWRLFAVAVPIAGAQTPMTISATVETGYFWTPAALATTPSTLGFFQEPGRLRLNEVSVGLNGDWGRVGFHVDGGYGDFYRLAMAGDSLKGPNHYISQMYAFVRPFANFPLQIDAGKFYSSVGAEVPQSYLNFNASRSLLFWFGSPLYHVGVRAILPVGRHFTLGAQLLNGSNTVMSAHGHQTGAFSMSAAYKNWGFSQLYLGGNQKTVGRGWRHLSDSILTVHPSKAVNGYAEFLWAMERRPAIGYDRWYGAAVALRLSPQPKWSFSPRLDWYSDPDGFTTGLPQGLRGATLTAEYRPVPVVIARVEYRREWSDRCFFPRASSGASRHAEAVIASITLFVSRAL